jgi:hypothetical protein
MRHMTNEQIILGPLMQIARRYDPESVLHELTHVVLGTESLSNKSCESYVLFPFEWAMIRNVFRRVQRKDPIAAQRFLRAATKYQDTTPVLDGSWYLADFGGRRGSLWKDAFRRAVEIGILTESGRLTFAYPTWGRVCRIPPTEWFAKWLSPPTSAPASGDGDQETEAARDVDS